VDAAPGARRHAVATVIEVTKDEDASHSEVFIQTRDRPGLLTDIVRTLKDINVNVVSAEVRRMGSHSVIACTGDHRRCHTPQWLCGQMYAILSVYVTLPWQL